MNWENKVTTLLGIKYPVVQAPMLVVSTPDMVAAVSNEGGLGSLALGYSDRDKAIQHIREVKKMTHEPFAVNLFAYEKQKELTIESLSDLRSIYQEYKTPFFDSLPTADPYTYYTELIEDIVAEGIKIISFHFGIPPKPLVEFLHAKNIVLMASATCVREAKMIEEGGIDIVVAQGIEAGGNRGTFIDGILPQVGLISLVPQIVDAVSIPVIAAGGIMQGRSIAAAFLLGASGVQMGSVFLRSKESGAPLSYKKAVADSNDLSSVLTKSWSGRYGRCIENDFVRRMENKDIAPAPFQNFLTNRLREFGRKQNITDIQSLWAGQSSVYAQEKTSSDLFKEIVSQAEQAFTTWPAREA